MTTDKEKEESERVGKILEVGKFAKVKLYQDLLARISNGETLRPTELNTLERLEKELAQGRPETDLPEVLSSYDEAAEYCGFSKRTLSYHIGKGNIKQNAQGTFDRKELDRYLSTRGRKSRTPTNVTEEIQKAELRYRKSRAAREEIIVKQLKAQLISNEEIQRQFTARAYELTRGLLVLSRRIAHKVAAKSKKKFKDVTAIIDQEVYDLLDRYSRPIEKKKNGRT